MADVDGVPVEGPRAYLERTALLVEGEELDVDGTETLVDGGRLPHDEAVRFDRRLRHQSHREVSIGAVRTQFTIRT